MESNYIKTTWVDNKTPVNAANLNKLESAVSELYISALDASSLVAGDGIELQTTESGCLEISATGTIASDNITSISVDQDAPLDGDSELGQLRIVLGDDQNITEIYFGGVSILSVAGQSEVDELTAKVEELSATVEELSAAIELLKTE